MEASSAKSLDSSMAVEPALLLLPSSDPPPKRLRTVPFMLGGLVWLLWWLLGDDPEWLEYEGGSRDEYRASSLEGDNLAPLPRLVGEPKVDLRAEWVEREASSTKSKVNLGEDCC